MNCWEDQACGREVGGSKVAELGVCPAAKADAGEACWMVAGTFCGDEPSGTMAQKQSSCVLCSFYKKFDMRHRANMRRKFKDYVG